MSERFLVTGATGMVGRLVLEDLCARDFDGVQVVALRRRASEETGSGRVRWVEGDLTRADSLDGIAAGCDTVLHVAGEMSPDPDQCFRVNRDGTRALLEEALAAGARRFVLVSSVAVYGDRELVQVDEATPRAAESPYARAKLAAEDLVLDTAASGRIEAVVIRPCPVLGVGAGHFAAGVRALVSMPEVPLPGGGRQRVDLVDGRDLARAIVSAARVDLPERSAAFHVSAGNALSMRAILEMASEASGTRPRFVPVSLEDACALNERASAASEPPPIPPPLLTYAMFERTYDATRAREALDFAPRPVRESLRDAVVACG